MVSRAGALRPLTMLGVVGTLSVPATLFICAQSGHRAAMKNVSAALALALATPASSAPTIVERPLADISAQLAAKKLSSVAVTRAYLARIAAMDRKGPKLRAVIAVNPDALAQARASDARRKAGRSLGPLDGVPILVKDNIETADPIATTAGSLALKDNFTRRDAPVIARLRAAGAVILGKTNLSEWANIRSTSSMSGWSAVGGLVRNPYALDRTSCGSSSGTGAAVAASFAAAGLGTETSGSVICPSSINGLVGPETDHRHGQPHPHRADQQHAGHRRPDGAQRARRRDPVRRDGRQRPRGSGHRGCRRPAARLCGGADRRCPEGPPGCGAAARPVARSRPRVRCRRRAPDRSGRDRGAGQAPAGRYRRGVADGAAHRIQGRPECLSGDDAGDGEDADAGRSDRLRPREEATEMPFFAQEDFELGRGDQGPRRPRPIALRWRKRRRIRPRRWRRCSRPRTPICWLRRPRGQPGSAIRSTATSRTARAPAVCRRWRAGRI